VIWGEGQLPAPLLQYQFDQGQLPPAYRQMGLARIMNVKGRGPTYKKCIDVIVQAILDIGRMIQLQGG